MPNFFLILFCVVCLLFPLGCNRARNQSIEWMNKGISQARGKSPQSAIDSFREAARLDPTYAMPLLYQGMLEYQKLGHLDQAEETLRKAEAIDPDLGEIHYHLGQVLAKKGLTAESADEFKESTRCSPNHAESFLRLGMALEKLGQVDRAQEAYRQAIMVDPHLPEAFNLLGNLYARFEQFEAAIQVFLQSNLHNPNFAANFRDLGLVYQTQKRYGEAISAFEKALALDQNQPGNYFNLGMTYAQLGDGDNALKYLKIYRQREHRAENQLKLQIAQAEIARFEAKQKR